MSTGSQFSFLATQWPAVHEAATRAEAQALLDPRTACFYARRAVEQIVTWLYRHEAALQLPYQDNLAALLHEPTFKTVAGSAVFNKAVLIARLGNVAVHSNRTITPFDGLTVARELFHLGFWLARHYGRGARPADGLTFDDTRLPKAAPVPPQTQEQLQRLAAQLAEKDAKLSELFADQEARERELAAVRKEIAAIKARNAATPDEHNYSEAQTRDYFIDLLLKEAGWVFTKDGHDTEYPVAGMPNQQKQGYVDYVLWGDDGRPLALVEAKRTRKSAEVGQQQAKLYADCLEREFGRRPVIFYSNGYEHWLWDDAHYPPRAVQGFYKKAELELLLQRRQTRAKLSDTPPNPAIIERYYQTRALRRIGYAFEHDGERKALLVMATGAGKTRTAIALCDVLMRANWVKRVLFLADRVALVNQAVNAFKKYLPQASPVNLVTEREAEGRVFVSTYPTVMGLIDEMKDGQRRFGPGHFDLIIIDEAHRSVYQKYAAIFRYFDALLVGLTATPREEIDRDTYGLFELEKGVPTDAYDLKEAVADKYLVPVKAVSVPLKFQREGIKYDDLSPEEQEQWDELEWDEEGNTPKQVDPEAVNKWLFNKDTVDKVLEHLMTHGQKVAGGDRLGKTIVFAKNQDHAQFIAERFDANYPHLKGAFARVIHCNLPYAQSLIDDFSNPAKMPHIALSVDMLDTGIDVPEVVNLVFFKLVRSKTKFWQMVGRGTRLCPHLFGPDRDKAFFYIFDYCQNLEYFSQQPEATEGSLSPSLGKRLFLARLEVLGALEQAAAGSAQECGANEATFDQELRAILQREVAAMNLENFVVRPQRRLVEQFARPEAWQALDAAGRGELAHHVAGLPSELDPEDEEAKRFDLLMLRLQLAVLRHEAGFERLRQQVIAIAGLLQEKAAIPTVQQQLAHILEIQHDEWWQDVTAPMLEQTRKRLRLLVKLIDKHQRKPVYSDFDDTLEPARDVVLAEFITAAPFEKFREKARAFLRAHQDELAIHKLRMNEPLTATDLESLERLLVGSGVATDMDCQQAKAESEGLGLFVRSLVGLDRGAAKAALGDFTAGTTLSANQIEFLDLIVDHLTDHGVMDPIRLYESPFTDFSDRGPEGLFTTGQIDALIGTLAQIRSTAVA